MAGGNIEFTFNDDLVNQEFISFLYGFGQSVTSTWTFIRYTSNQVTIGTPIEGSPGERSAINYAQALQLDLADLPFTITRIGNKVRVQSNNVLYNFQWIDGSNKVSYELDNDTEDLLYFNNVTFAQASENPCKFVKVDLETTIPIQTLLSPTTIQNVDSTTVSFNVLRGQSFTIKAETAGGQDYEIYFDGISVLNNSNLNLTIQNTPAGSNVIANLENEIVNTYSEFDEESIHNDEINLEFSLDEENWQNSNVFNSLSPGEYTLYVRDQYGCTTQKSFTADEYSLNAPYFYISKANSIRFANRIEFGDSSNYKNDENTLSCEANVPLPYKEIQQFQSGDIITTQFLSNYEDIEVEVIDLETNEINTIETTRKSNNIGLREKRDAQVYSLPENKTGIYFLSGNIYNIVTNQVQGDYSLNGRLPEWGVVGNFVRINSIWYQIEEIIFDEAVNADVLVVSGNITPDEYVVMCVYNRRNYNIFEFDIDFFNYLNKKIQVKITNSDEEFGEVILLSEEISVKVRHPDTIEIRYKNIHNTDIFYMTGIENKIRVPINKISGGIDEETETAKNDTSTDLITATVLETDVFEFEPVTKEIMRKIVQALSHSDVYLDGVGYVKSEIEIEGPLEDTNLYIVRATMIKSENVYKSDSGSLEFATGNTEIPGLINVDSNGFVRY